MRGRISNVLSALVLLACLTSVSGARQKPQRRAPAVGSTVVFAVQKSEEMTTMEPVVIVSRGVFLKPPVSEGDVSGNVEERARAFIGEYFRPGRQYGLLFGGGEAGKVTVQKYLEPGCVGMTAQVGLDTQARLGGEVKALATNSQTLGRPFSSRRAPTDFERLMVLEAARSKMTQNGVRAALAKKMEVINLTATDLDHDDKDEFVGSFRVEQNAGQTADAYTLFMILESDGATATPALTWFHHGGEAEYADRRLVDVIDLDGDGLAEVVVEGHYYESNDYFIYKKQKGSWQVVYQGGGGGC